MQIGKWCFDKIYIFMQIFSLSEGSFTIDKTKIFIPFSDEENLQDRAPGSLLVEIQPFVVKTEKDILLLDTGLGFSEKKQLQLFSNLQNVGIQPADITKILLSHLHKDHSGGLALDYDFNNLAFPNATYYIQENELLAAAEGSGKSYANALWQQLYQSPQVCLLQNTKGLIDQYISYEVTHAHSPHHQVFWIKEKGETIFFGGDDAPQLKQMKHRVVAKYDYDGKKAMELRQTWWEQGEKEKWTFLFYHDVQHPSFSF